MKKSAEKEELSYPCSSHAVMKKEQIINVIYVVFFFPSLFRNQFHVTRTRNKELNLYATALYLSSLQNPVLSS